MSGKGDQDSGERKPGESKPKPPQERPTQRIDNGWTEKGGVYRPRPKPPKNR